MHACTMYCLSAVSQIHFLNVFELQLQRYRQLVVAQKSAERTAKPSKENTIEEMQESALDLIVELKSVAKSNGGNDGGISIFKDASAEKKLEVEGRGPGPTSIKNRMKQSLAQRRTALQSRNVNVPSDADTGGDKRGGLKKSLGALSNSEVVKSESKSEVNIAQARTGEKSDKENTKTAEDEPVAMEVVAVEDDASIGDVSLHLDDTAASEVVDSMEASADESDANAASCDDKEFGSDDDCTKYSGNATVLETWQEEPAENHNDIVYNDIMETDQEELISVVASCASVNSKSSSLADIEELEHQSPMSNGVSESSPLTPADSIQTFSIGSTSQKSHVSCHNSGITHTGSIQTFSIGGRSLNITSDPFKTSIFSPSLRNDDISVMESDCGTEASHGGQTVIPDISIPDGSHLHAFPSPMHRMLYASPTGKSNFSLSEVSHHSSASSSLYELSRQLEAARSHKKESNAPKLLRMYDEAHAEVEMKASANSNMNQCASPVSKALATGDSSGLSKSAAASLIDRNKTLVKEVRFADQTCVELSERNLSITREIHRLEVDVEELKGKNDSLHDAVVRSSQASARLEESKKEMELKLGEERKRFKLQLDAASQSLQEEKDRTKELAQKLEESTSVKSLAEQNVASMTARYEAIRDEHSDAKEAISSLRERLTTIESTSELAATAAAQKYRESSYEMQKKIDNLQDEMEERDVALHVERGARRQAEEEILELREFYEQLESSQIDQLIASPMSHREENTTAKVYSPCSTSSQASKKTTASTVLAKTLQVELERGHGATERIIEAERIITVTQSKLRGAERDLKLARDETASLQRQLRKTGKRAKVRMSTSLTTVDNLNDSMVSSEESAMDNEVMANWELSQKLLSTRSQCEEYKRELDSILSQIKGILPGNVSSIQASVVSNNAMDSCNLLNTVKELAHVCTRVNVAAGDRVDELEDRIQYLTRSMNQLHEICNEDQSEVSVVSYSLQMMEEGTTTTTPVKTNKTPTKVLYLQDNDGTGTYASLTTPLETTPVKVVRLRDELHVTEELLMAVSDEKDVLADALNEARIQVEFLTSSVQASTAALNGMKELKQEKTLLEHSVFRLRSQIGELENRIENLEEDKAYLFDDAEARVDELEEASGKIDTLQKEVRELADLLQQLSEEKQRLSDELANVETSHKNERDALKATNSHLEKELSVATERIQCLSTDIERQIGTLRDVEASRIRLEADMQAISCQNDNQVNMVHQLQETLSQTREQANELKSSFMNCNEELVETIEAKTELEAVNKELQTLIRAQQGELDIFLSTTESTSDECDALRNKLSTTEDAYESMHEELVKMGSQVEVLCEVNDEYEADLIEADELRNDMQIELEQCRSKVESLASQLDASKDALVEKEEALSKSKAHLEIIEDKFDEFETEVAEKNEAMSVEFETKEQELELLRVQLNEAEQKLQQIEQLNISVQVQEVELEFLRTNLHETKQQLTEQCVNHDAAIEQL